VTILNFNVFFLNRFKIELNKPGNYLAEHADEAGKIIKAAKIISAPWDVEKGQ
jgi:hypothetical protein